MAKECKVCQGTDFATSNDGSIVCTSCATIAESSNIVSEIQFTEGSSVVGNFVSSRPSRYRSLGRDSRELSVENAKRRIEEIAAPLHIRPHHIDSALRSFELALENGFTKGRRTRLVGAACLYTVCRREQTPHLLIDFSEILQVNVFTLANTFLQLIKTLNIRLPIVDPSIFIQRFSQSLEFAEKTNVIVTTANKLVQRMKRDWMATGRKPSGICGAALYMASKIHGFKRSLKEIIHVVKVGEVTLLRRLNEFQKTPTANLKIHEFDTMEIEQERDPPSFFENKKRQEKKELKRLKKLQGVEEINENDGDDESDSMDVDSDDGKKKPKKRKLKKKKKSIIEDQEKEKEQEGEEEEEEEEEEDEEEKEEVEKPLEETIENKDENNEISLENNNNNNNNNEIVQIDKEKTVDDELNNLGSEERLHELLKEAQESLTDNKEVIDQFESTNQPKKDDGKIKKKNNNNKKNKKKNNNNIQNNYRKKENDEDQIPERRKYIPSALDTDEGLKEYLAQELQSLEDTVIEVYPPFVDQGNNEVDPSVFEPTDDLEGLDDLVEEYIETDKLVIEKKEKIWVHLNHDWILKDEDKKREMEEDIAAGRPPRKRKSTTNTAKKAAETAAAVAQEALKKTIRNTKLIEKFGLVLPNLFEGSARFIQSSSSGGGGESTQTSHSTTAPSPSRPTGLASRLQHTEPEPVKSSLLSKRLAEYEDDGYE